MPIWTSKFKLKLKENLTKIKYKINLIKMKLNINYGLNKPVKSQLSNDGGFKFLSKIRELPRFKFVFLSNSILIQFLVHFNFDFQDCDSRCIMDTNLKPPPLESRDFTGLFKP